MASVQDVANAAYRIGQSAQEAQARSMASADSLKNHSARLAATVRGSRTGEDAVRLVNQAERNVRESAARLATLRSTIDSFIQDLTK
jgi:hypothetical protein